MGEGDTALGTRRPRTQVVTSCTWSPPRRGESLHSDAGSQLTSLAFTEKLLEPGITAQGLDGDTLRAMVARMRAAAAVHPIRSSFLVDDSGTEVGAVGRLVFRTADTSDTASRPS
jgi:hypothetical protein